jgi:excisionase family DNA binding protein
MISEATEERRDALMSNLDVQAYTGHSDSTIRRAARRGDLRGFKMPGGLRFYLADVDAWVEKFAIEPETQRRTRPRLSDRLAVPA